MFIKEAEYNNERLIFTVPNAGMAEEIAAYRQDFLNAGDSMDGCGPLRRFADPEQWLSETLKYTEPATVPADKVQATQFVCLRARDGRVLGMLQVRHTLNRYLKEYAGHIGYSVRPSERRKGYAEWMLQQALGYCRSLGLPRVMVSCEPNNVGSRRTILASGGVYENTVWEPDEKIHLERYWIELSEPMRSIHAAANRIADILSGNRPSVYLYGSVVLDDFRLGWSDIDLLVLTEKQISPEQAERLVHLRRALTEREPENPYYRLLEGGMLSLSAFLTGAPDTVVYWGTSGERITNHYAFDSFCKLELSENGVLLYGKDVRDQMRRPSYEDLKEDVRRHYESIREHGCKTGKSLYSFGWLLDISRCIYTLRTGKIIAKTKAGEWALENGLCPDAAALKTALRVRKEPKLFDKDETLRQSAENLGNAIRSYADVLQKELMCSMKTEESQETMNGGYHNGTAFKTRV